MANNGPSEARHSNRLTEAQVNAILKAHLIDGTRRSEIAGLARTGRLDVPAFHVGMRYVYQVIKRRQEQFELEHPTALAKSTEAMLTKLHAANLKALRQIPADTDPGERARLARALAQTSQALTSTRGAAAKTQTSATENRSNEAPANSAPDVITGLLAGTKAKAKTASQSPEPSTAESARSGSLSLARNPNAA